jgi:dihydroorotate dehydrogenase
MSPSYLLARRILFLLDAERAHGLVSKSLQSLSFLPTSLARSGALWQPRESDRREAWGMSFRTALGLAAGMDKNATLVEAMAALGFGFVEVGTVTPKPQPGNPRPRLMRDPERNSLWNRMGFNSEGAEVVARRLSSLRERESLPPNFRIGVNLGKNRDTPLDGAASDYMEGARRLAPLADYLVINVSSPNTPGLRGLQEISFLRPLLEEIRAQSPKRVPCLVKVAPELSSDELRGLSDGVGELVDGWITSNTLAGLNGSVQGGWSGQVLREAARGSLSGLAACTRLPTVSVGGIDGPAEARLRLQQGAALLQIYSALVFEGPGLVRAITEGIRPDPEK